MGNTGGQILFALPARKHRLCVSPPQDIGAAALAQAQRDEGPAQVVLAPRPDPERQPVSRQKNGEPAAGADSPVD
jgi:hypothetical protein